MDGGGGYGGGDLDGESDDFEFYSDLYLADVGIDPDEWYYDDGGVDDADAGCVDEEDDDDHGCGGESIQEAGSPRLVPQCPLQLWVMQLVG